MPRRGSRQPGDITHLRRVLWRTILEVEALLDARPPSNELVLKSAHALAQLAGAYRSVLETSDLAQRLTALEHQFEESPNGAISGRPAGAPGSA
jgi:hypothetical protein